MTIDRLSRLSAPSPMRMSPLDRIRAIEDPLLWPAIGYLALSLLLGGSSAAGFVANAALQLSGLAILVGLMLSKPRLGTSRAGPPFLVLGLAFVAIAVCQLIPLPPPIWTALDGREAVARQHQLLGIMGSWVPLSLSPEGTVRAIVSALPPLAMLCLTTHLTQHGIRILIRCFVAMVAISAFYGLLQLGAGGLYLYKITNLGKSVGFFANSNHQATLMLVALPLTIAARQQRSTKQSNTRVRGALDVWLLAAGALIAVCAIGTGSLAAVGLLIVAGGGCYFLWLGDRLGSRATLQRLSFTILLSLAVVVAGAFFLGQVAMVVTLDSTEGNRLVFAQDTIEAIRHLGVFGSGLGTFVDIYPAYQAIDRVSRTYVNHAHNDWLELCLETGILGVLLLLAFLIQLTRSTVAAFRAPVRFSLPARASVICIVIIGLHSLVDYPLRTGALAVVFAMLCGFLRSDGSNRIGA